MKTHKYEDIIFEIGENAKDNWEIFERNKEIDSDYVWFHLNSFPSHFVQFQILYLHMILFSLS